MSTSSVEKALPEVHDPVARRALLAGPPGFAGLRKQPRLMRLAAITTLGTLCYGYEQGAYSQVLVMPAFTSDPRFARIGYDAGYKGWTVSILGLGGWFGSLINGYLCDLLSRRWCLFIGGLICLLGTALTTGAQYPSYFFIVAAPEVRGSIVSIQQLAIEAGICISFWIGYGTNYISDTNSASWRVCLACQGIPALLLCILSLYLPYTPRWLVRNGRIQEAHESLAWIRNRSLDDELVRIELLEVRAEAMFEAEVTAEKFPNLVKPGPLNALKLQVAQFVQLFRSAHMFRRTAVACLIQFFQQMSGIDGIIYYAPTLFSGLGLSGKTTSLLASGVVGLVFFFSTFPAIVLIDRIGRRALLIIGGSGMAISLIVVSACVGSFQADWAAHQTGAWTAAVFIWMYVGWFGFSWGPVSWTVISEVFPLSTRGHGVALGASTNWMTDFVIGVSVPLFLERTAYGVYVYFLAFTLMGIAYAIWILPETRGKSLEEMDLAFGSGEGQADISRMQRIRRDLGIVPEVPHAGESNEKLEVSA